MTKVSITEFNELTLDEKAWYLWHGASFLHVYESNGFRINLFHFNDFYIELWYDIRQNSVGHIRAFTSIAFLEPFLDNIDVNCLLTE